eukprot:6180084-Pleurochrysis_carterae.AAC.2
MPDSVEHAMLRWRMDSSQSTSRNDGFWINLWLLRLRVVGSCKNPTEDLAASSAAACLLACRSKGHANARLPAAACASTEGEKGDER